MKKKGFIALLLLVAMICSLAFSSCTLVQLNEERQANRIMATVSKKVELTNETAKKMLKDKLGITEADYDISLEINRRELISSTNYSINRMADAYSSLNYTYNYDYETVLGDTLDSLIESKFYVIKAIEYLLNYSSEEHLKSMYMFAYPEEYKAVYGNKLSAEGVLTVSERYAAISSINETLQSMLDGYIEDEDAEIRNNRISSADNKISEYYEKGYFVTGVYLLKEVEAEENVGGKTPYVNQAGENEEGIVVYTDDGEKFVSGLYDDNFVLSGKVDTDDSASDAPASSELDYKQVFVGIELTLEQKDGDVVVYVPRPASESSYSITRKTDADFVSKYIRTREVAVSYTGRVYEDNDDGYTTEEFTSDKTEYRVAFARNALAEEAEEVDYIEVEGVRFSSKEAWEAFLAVYNKEEKKIDKEYDESYAELYDAFSNLYAEPFSTKYVGTDKNVKDGYRQLKNTLSSANIGYIDPEKAEDVEKGSQDYINMTYYSGLFIYYNEQFMSAALDAVKHEIGLREVVVSGAEIYESYLSKVRQDKVNYDTLGYTDQINKFFSDTTDISETYYVPFAALAGSQYEVDPTDKSYAALFTVADGVVTDYDHTYVTEIDGKYYMNYIYENEDGTYTINAFFVGALLFSFGNDEDINDRVVISDSVLQSIDGYQDLPYEEKVARLRTLAVEYLTTTKQITEDGMLQKDVTAIEQLFDLDENGEPKSTAIKTIMEELKAEADGKTREEILEIFEKYMAIYNDDSGKLSDPGYLITSGDVKDSWAMADFADGARAIYYGLLAAGENPKTTANAALMFGEGMTYYGLHYMMVTFAPYYQVKLIDVDNDGTPDALNPTTVINLAGDTQAKLIEESLRTSKISSKYSDWQASFSDDTIAEATVRNEDNYKKLVKDINDK